MSKKNHSKNNANFIKKQTLEALQYQTHWGLKKLGLDEGHVMHQWADVEIERIVELHLEEEILGVKKLVKEAKIAFDVAPIADAGDFAHSVVALALGISSTGDLSQINEPVSWADLVRKKILSIVYDEEYRNGIVNWAKENGFNTSTYLGQPIVKFHQIYTKLERKRKETNE